MATVHQVLSAMQSIVSQQMVGVVSARGPLTIQVAAEWPPMKVLQQNVKGGSAIVAIFDRRRGLDSTRWIPALVSESRQNPLLMSSIVSTTLPSSLYVGGTIQAGDAVSLIAQIPPTFTEAGHLTRSAAVVATVTASSTTATVASALAAAVNSDPLMSLFIAATVSGSVVSLSAIANDGAPSVFLTTNVGSTGSRVVEVGRRDRELQISVWTAYEEDRMAVGDAIEAVLSGIEVFRSPYDAGVTFPDGSNGRLRMMNDYYIDDAVLSGALRRDFLLRVDHPVTNIDVLYSVLAPVMQYSL